MRNRSQEFVIGLSRLVLIVFVLSVSLISFAGQAMAQNPPTSPSTTSQNPCECWIDVKTGKRVPTAPISGANYYKGSDPEEAGAAGVALLSKDGKSARNSRTGQNYGREPDGCWIDVKTGKRVPTAPISGANYYKGSDPEEAGAAGVALLSEDGKSARNSRTGQNYALEPCPAPTEKKVIEKKKEVCDIEFGYEYMRAPDESAKSLNGFGGSLFCNVKSWIAIGGDFGALFGSTTDTVGTTKVDVSLHRQTYLFGPQFNFYPNDKVKIFVHPLFGGVHDTTKTTIGTTTTDFSANAFAMAFGGGVDVNLNHRFAIQPIQFDYVPTHFGGAWQSNYRISTGLVIRLGKK